MARAGLTGRAEASTASSPGANAAGPAVGRDPHAALARIAARIPLGEAVAAMAGEFRLQIPAFARLSGGSEDEIAQGVNRSVRRFWRWLTTGAFPADSDFDPLREWARARATEGVRLEDLLRAFGLGAQVGWQLIRRYARSDETAAVLDGAGLVMQYVDRVSAVVTDTYLAEREVLVSEDERRTRNLLDRLCGASPLDSTHLELARRLGVPLDRDYMPFAAVIPGLPPQRHAAVAARLRGRGWTLTVTEGDRVVGLTWKPMTCADLGEGTEVVFAIASPAGRGELVAAREEVVLLAELGRRLGLRGRIEAEDHLLEILVGRSPLVAARLRARVLGALEAPQHEELRRTLVALFRCHFDRAATSAALHIHRNTLAYRVGQITEITGLNLDNPRDLASAYLALGPAAEQPPLS